MIPAGADNRMFAVKISFRPGKTTSWIWEDVPSAATKTRGDQGVNLL